MAARLDYRAFLSYSHDDAKDAVKLHKLVSNFTIDKKLVGKPGRRGPVPPNLRPIFRDREDFTSGTDLKTETLQALRRSEALVVLCSPAAAASGNVNEEVRQFRHAFPDRPVIPVVLKGPSVREVCPPAVWFNLTEGGQVSSEASRLLAIDLREDRDGFDAGLIRIVASLIGIDPKEVARREAHRVRRDARRRMAIASSVSAVLACLLVLSEVYRRAAVESLRVALATVTDVTENSVENLRNEPGVKAEVVRRVLQDADRNLQRLTQISEGNKDIEYLGVRIRNAMTWALVPLGNTEERLASALDAQWRGLALLDGSVQRRSCLELTLLDDIRRCLSLSEITRNLKALTAARGETRTVNALGRLELVRAYSFVGDAYRDRFEMSKAQKAYWMGYLRVLQEKPSSVNRRRIYWQTANALNDLAEECQRRGDFNCMSARLAQARTYSHLAIANMPIARRQQRNLRFLTSETVRMLAALRWAMGDLAGWSAALDSQQAIVERLIAIHGGRTDLVWSLAAIFERRAEMEEALGNFGSSAKLIETSRAMKDGIAADPGNARVHMQLLEIEIRSAGSLRPGRDKIERLQKAVGGLDDLLRNDPASYDLLAARAWGLQELALANRDLGEYLKAESSLREALSVRERIAARSPEDSFNLRQMARVRLDLGSVLRARGQSTTDLDHGSIFKAALGEFEASKSICRDLRKREAKHFEWQWCGAVAEERLGGLKAAEEDFSGAISQYVAATGIYAEMARQAPTRRDLKFNIAVTQRLLVEARSNLWLRMNRRGPTSAAANQELDTTIAVALRAVAIMHELRTHAPSHRRWAIESAYARAYAGQVLLWRNRKPAAVQQMRECVALLADPAFAPLQPNESQLLASCEKSTL